MEDDHERRPDGVQRPERRDEVGKTRVREGEGELDVGLVDGALRAGHEVDAPAPRHDARGEPCLDEGGVLAGRTPTPERAGLRVHEHWGDGGRRGGDIRALGVTAFSGHVKRRSEGWDVRCRRVWQSRPDAGAKTRYETLARIRKQRKRAGRTGYSPTSGRPGPNAVS